MTETATAAPPAEDLTASDFVGYYKAVHGAAPYAWQKRMARDVLRAGRWGDDMILQADTGVGKTSVLDVAVFAMAARPEAFPRRVVFVINRRIVVDEVHARVEKINVKLAAAESGAAKAVADSLRWMSRGRGEELLGTVALRGGKVLTDDWTRHLPDRPWVTVSTIDQYGSRLLHRGYGASPRTRPVHAGLAGNDCLVVLDEMHTSTALYETILGVRAADGRHKRPAAGGAVLPDRFGVLRMSATPGPPGGEDNPRVFKLTDKERSEPGLRRRLSSQIVVTLVAQTGGANPEANRGLRADAAVEKLAELDDKPKVQTVAVIANTVASAQTYYRRISTAGYRAHLLTGWMRPLDKAAAVEEIAVAADPDRPRDDDRGHGSKPAVVVSTQSMEVGADYDFDAMITECAPADSLRQRFGRLDRKGEYSARGDDGENPRAWILQDSDDPVYAKPGAKNPAAATWKWLNSQADRKQVVIGPKFWDQAGPELDAARAPAPRVLQTHLKDWGRTICPPGGADTQVGDFLHGIGASAHTDVNVCWRADRSPEALRVVPPRASEMLPLPLWAARWWIARRRSGPAPAVADLDTPAAAGQTGPAAAGCVRWPGPGADPEPVAATSGISAGDTLIVDPGYGGINGGSWDPAASSPVEDLGEQAQADYGRAVIRFHDRHTRGYMPEGSLPAGLGPDADPAELAAWVESALNRVQAHAPEGSWAAAAAEALLAAAGNLADLADLIDSEDGGYWTVSCRIPGARASFAGFGGDGDSDSFTGAGTTLAEHSKEVAQTAEALARSLGFPDRIAADIGTAGRCHDIGKADPRWQDAITGGDPEARLPGWAPLAKSPAGVRPNPRLFPPVRHEFVSAAMAAADPDLSCHDRDLVLHLIASHHGYARPLPAQLTDPAPVAVSYETASCNTADLAAGGEFAAESSERFERLTRRYSYYGLAWMEAVLRMADWAASAGAPIRPPGKETT